MTYNQFQYNDLLARHDDAYAVAKYQIIVDFLAKHAPARILNVGCGSGELSYLLAAAGHNVLGIDPVKEYIDLAENKKPICLEKSCFFKVGGIEDFKEKGEYDCVIATDVLEHIPDDGRALRRMAEMLHPGGFLIITVPALPVLFGYHDEQLGHERRYTKSGMRRLVLKDGLFEMIRLRYFGFFLLPICLLYSKILRKSYPVSPARKGRLFFLRAAILKAIFYFERLLSPPLGISLICVARKK